MWKGYVAMGKKVLSLLLAMSLVMSMIPVTTYAEQEVEAESSKTEIIDMPDDWSTKALKNAVNNGLLSGYEREILPKDNLTRAQMAAIVNRAFGTVEKASLNSYTDVPETAWYYSDMAKAVQMKTFVGSGEKLNPTSNITREEAFVVLARAFKLSGTSESALDQFSDKALVSTWAKDKVAALVTSGYVAGSNGTLNPKENITRAEFAQLMDNIIKQYIKKAGTYTENVKGNLMVNAPDVILENMKIAGDLIIGDGVGDGDVTLDSVIVTGRTVIRGGGVNSIKILGDSDIQNITIARVDGKLRVFTEDGLEIGEVIVDGNDDVIIEGHIGTITITASDIRVTATHAKVQNAEIEGENVEVLVEEGSTIEKIIVNGKGGDVRGQGTVGEVEAKAENLTVSTPGTKVMAANSATGIMAGTIPVSEGETEIVPKENRTKKYRLTVKAKPSEAGSVSHSGSYVKGDMIELTAEPETTLHYQFVNWTLNGKVISTSETLEYKMPNFHHTLVANFIPEGSVPVASISDLHNIANDLNADYVQVANIDLNAPPYNEGAGWVPIGNHNNPFTGTFNGNDYTITNLRIMGEEIDHAGLFGVIDNAHLRNVDLQEVNISARHNVGGLIGTSYSSSVTDSQVEGAVEGNYLVGGLIGLSEDSIITDSLINGSVSGDYLVGGLAGANGRTGEIINGSSDAEVSGFYMVGGLIGKNLGAINDCSATGNVIGRKVNNDSTQVQAARLASFSTVYEGIARQPEAAGLLTGAAIELAGEAGDLSSSELQAARLASFSTVYEGIARQPEAAELITEAAIGLAGETGDISSPEAQAAKLKSFSTVYEGIARNPDAAELMTRAAIELAGETGDISSPEAQAARLESFSTVYEGIARQPEVAELITSTAIELAGEEGDLSSSEVQAARLKSFSALYESIARQPEVAELITSTAIELAGEAGNLSSSEVQAASLKSFSTVYEGLARQPEVADLLIGVAIELAGEAGDLSSSEVQTARLKSFSALYESIARQPEAAKLITSTAIELAGEAGDISSRETQVARLESFSTVYEGLARQPSQAELLIGVAIELAGEAGDLTSSEVQAARLKSFSAVYEGLARQPSLAEFLMGKAIELAGEAGDLSSWEVQAARLESFNTVYAGIARQPELADLLTGAAIRLAGEGTQWTPPEVQAARIRSFSDLYEGIARQPEAAGLITGAAILLSGEKPKWTSPELQVARMESLSGLYAAIARQPEMTDTLIKTAKELTGEIEDWLFPKVQTGGLVGVNSGTITSSFSSGNVTGWCYSGGLVGVNSGEIAHSFALNTRLMTAATNAEELSFGRITGVNTGTLIENYANKYMEEPFLGAFEREEMTESRGNGGNLDSWDIDGEGNLTPVLEDEVITFSFDGIHANKLINVNTNMTYSIDGGVIWTPCSESSMDLTASLGLISANHDIKVRSGGAIYTIDITQADTPTYTINYATETTTQGIPSIVEYATDSDMLGANSGLGTAIPLGAGTDVYFKVKASGTVMASEVQHLEVPIRPVLGTISINGQTDTEGILLNGNAIEAEDGYEYQQNAEAWTPLTTGLTFDFTGDTTFTVRKAATNNAFASEQSTDIDTP